MECYRIKGGVPLEGICTLPGAKNAALPILAASLLCEGESRIRNCPDLLDVDNMIRLLETLGCGVKREEDAVIVDPSGIRSADFPDRLMTSMRSSMFLWGPMLARCGSVTFFRPGGCPIGARPVDIHMEGFRKMGAEIVQIGSELECRAEKLKGADFRLSFPSVGATENLMMAAVFADGETRIRNAAREPEIEDLQNYINACGGCVRGAGTGMISVTGTGLLKGAEYSVMPDRIQGGTLLLGAAMTGGTLCLNNISPAILETLLGALERCGCSVLREAGAIRLNAPERLDAAGYLITEPYPGFPTDLQSLMLAAMCFASGKTVLEETIFENRFLVVPELRKMGADITVNGRIATVTGKRNLHGAAVSAGDLRGGAALVLAGLAVNNETIVENICHIDRGYDKFEVTLSCLGAKIDRIGEKERWNRIR